MLAKKIIRGTASILLAASILAGTAYADLSKSVDDMRLMNTFDNSEDDNLKSMFAGYFDIDRNSDLILQDGMRAVFLTPGVDFETKDPDLPALFDKAAGYGMNAVIINTAVEGEDFYNLELGEDDLIGSAIDAARYAGLGVYVTLDVNLLIKRVIEQGGGLKDGFSAAVHKFAMKYICDGLIIRDYYTADSEEMHAEYLRSGSGIGYENWLYETNRYIMRTLSDVIRKTTCSTAVGIYIEDMWANSSQNDQGSETSAEFSALYDGHCDTKAYIEQGFADFILVKAECSTESEYLNYNNVVSWWNELSSKSGTKMYVTHMNENIGAAEGWYVDELLKQLADLGKFKNIGGSAFSSFAALGENKLDSTTKLIEYFNGLINTDALSKVLTINSPSKTSYTTTDNNVKFQGSFDENFDVYFNGDKIELNAAGTFFFNIPLKVGNNYFVIEHKGEKREYNINRYVEIFKSVENTENITVEGGTRIALSAIVYSGSNVSASINGKIVPMTEQQNSDKVDANSSYSEYVGYYTVPDGIIGKEQNLGKISYYATYQEPGSKKQEAYDHGGTVIVEAKPEPPKEDINYDIKDQATAGTGEVVGTMDPVVSEKTTVKYIKVLNNFAKVYDPKMTGRIPTPELLDMPEGTLDYYKSTVGEYYVSTSGKRYRQSEAKIITDKGLGDNPLVVKSVGNLDGKSFIEISLGNKVSFTVTTSVDYHTQVYGDFGVANFNAQYVYITFDNITSVTKLPDFSSCALFSEGRWETVTVNGVPKFRMVLKLRQAGIYSGALATYKENKTLMLTFNVPTSSLAGKTIVIDPGHGYNKDGYPNLFDPGAIGIKTEQEIALGVAKKLEAKLKEMGANVIRYHTEDTYYPVTQRSDTARQYDPDLYISLHCNSIDNNDSAHGVEVYYFTPFSQPLAEAINDGLASLYDNKIYADGTHSNRGEKYSYYHVTLAKDFPSVLVEMGFVSNDRECLMMWDPNNQDLMADELANSIKSYFARSQLNY